MSLSKTKRCAVETCRKTEDQTEIKTCSKCKVMTYCSRLCQKVDFASHQDDCRQISKKTLYETAALHRIAFVYDNYQALRKAVDDEYDEGYPIEWMICFYIELGNGIHKFVVGHDQDC